jgi:hypothetical protein
MKAAFFENNPIENLLLRNKGKEYVCSKYLGTDIKIKEPHGDNSDLKFMQRCYPEAYKEVYDRAVTLQGKFYWNIRNSKYTKRSKGGNPGASTPKVAVICFTHGALVKTFNQVIARPRVNDFTSVSYCCISAMAVKDKKSRHELKMFDDHLKGDLVCQ